MPSYKSHLVGALVVYTIAIMVFFTAPTDRFTHLEWLLCVLAGSLFPDIDTKSKGQRLFYGALLVTMIALVMHQKMNVLACCAVFACLPLLVKHRGIFHSVWFIIGLNAMVVALVGAYFPHYFKTVVYDSYFFMLGAFSHLLLDRGFRRMWR